MKQESPFTVKIELSEGCNLACTFCGINSIRPKAGGPFFFMSPATAERIASEVARVGWNPRIEMAMHGEPSMNPKRVEIIAAIRKHLPKVQIMMTSNGGGLLKDTTESIDAMFAAGLNILALDEYQNVNLIPKIRERYKGAVEFIDYPASKAHNPYRRYPKSTKMIIVMLDISVPQDGVHNRLDNMGGLAFPKTFEQQGKRCSKPFRDMAFRWNGNVSICCDDWRGQYQIGSIADTAIDTLWNNDRFTAARKKLYHGERDFGPCHGCSDVSYRVGLLPDKLGKQSLGKATQKDKQAIFEAVTGKPWTAIVKRPWEGK
jgi:hypothetical protein